MRNTLTTARASARTARTPIRRPALTAERLQEIGNGRHKALARARELRAQAAELAARHGLEHG